MSILRRILNIPRKIRKFYIRHIFKHRFAECGYGFSYDRYIKVHGFDRIHLGNDVIIAENTWLAAVPYTNDNDCKLTIGNHSRLGAYNHIYATGGITIEDNVLTANSVYISDNLHEYEDTPPIYKQPIKQTKKVIIGEGCWIGEHACIIGASVGKHSVVGANAVVTHDIPDYCVAVGMPAYIIKRYNPDSQSWEKTDKHGNFIKKMEKC